MKFTNLTNKTDKGFTLIELLVVIAIIGILSSVVLASMNTARKKARDARRQADLKSLQLALESYYDTNSNYPIAATETDVVSTHTELAELVSQGMITVLPDDPASAKNYRYRTDATGSEYCIGAALEGTVPTPADTCPTTKVSGDTAGGSANPVNWMVGQ